MQSASKYFVTLAVFFWSAPAFQQSSNACSQQFSYPAIQRSSNPATQQPNNPSSPTIQQCSNPAVQQFTRPRSQKPLFSTLTNAMMKMEQKPPAERSLWEMGAPALMRSPGLYYMNKTQRGTGPYRNSRVSTAVKQDAPA